VAGAAEEARPDRSGVPRLNRARPLAAAIVAALSVTLTGCAAAAETCEPLDVYPDLSTVERLQSADLDLDGDGIDERVLRPAGGGWCGSGGCTMFVAKVRGEQIEVISRTTITALPIRVLETRTNGWRDLAVTQYFVGKPPELKRLQFDGCRYPLNPSMPPTTPVPPDSGEAILDQPQAG